MHPLAALLDRLPQAAQRVDPHAVVRERLGGGGAPAERAVQRGGVEDAPGAVDAVPAPQAAGADALVAACAAAGGEEGGVAEAGEAEGAGERLGAAAGDEGLESREEVGWVADRLAVEGEGGVGEREERDVPGEGDWVTAVGDGVEEGAAGEGVFELGVRVAEEPGCCVFVGEIVCSGFDFDVGGAACVAGGAFEGASGHRG